MSHSQAAPSRPSFAYCAQRLASAKMHRHRIIECQWRGSQSDTSEIAGDENVKL